MIKLIDNNQTIIPNSVVIDTDSFGNNNNFIPSGSFSGANINVTSKQLKIKIAQCHQALAITYQTKITNYNENNVNTYNNVVHYQINGETMQQASSYVKYGGGGTATGYEGRVQLIKEDATTHQKLAGATFELVSKTGHVLYTNLVTNAQGQINLEKLLPGTYAFVETKAPQGYALNKTPYVFTIARNNSAIVKVMATDAKLKPSVVSSSTSSTKASNSKHCSIKTNHKQASPTVVIPSSSSIITSQQKESTKTNDNNNQVSSIIPTISSIHAKTTDVVNHHTGNSKKHGNNKLPQTGDNNQSNVLLRITAISMSILIAVLG